MKKLIKLLMISIIIILISCGSVMGAEKWSGNDVVVGNKIKEISGTEAKKPIINLSGDLGLFVFALGGFAAGVIVGYQWRKVFFEKKGD